MESQRSPEPLRRALSVRKSARGRVFARHGNHGDEAPQLVRYGAEANVKFHLLVDEAAIVDTGRVAFTFWEWTCVGSSGRTYAESLDAHPRNLN